MTELERITEELENLIQPMKEDSNIIPDILMDNICRYLTKQEDSVAVATYMHLDDTRSSLLIEMKDGRNIKGIFTLVEEEEE